MARRKPDPSAVDAAQNTISNAIDGITDLFVPNPKRKGWEQLSPAYRSRLERGGITQDLYQRGKQLAKARGHVSTRKEAEDSYFYRDRRKFVREHATLYGKTEEELRETLDELSRAQVEDLIAEQRKAEKAYNDGDATVGKRAWESRNSNLPDWLYWYHGLFH